jgi:excisionase family DNA binding protein
MSRGKQQAPSGAVSEANAQLGAGRAVRGSARPSTRPSIELEEGRPRLWNIEEVAEYLQLSIHSIYKMTARKAAVRIPYIRIGGKLRFRQADVDRWLTLLTVSDLERLARVRQKALKVSHGHDSQT